MNRDMYMKALRGAVDYARADRSDPFTFNRVMTHLSCGVTNPRTDKDRREALYGAETVIDQRYLRKGEFSDGTKSYHGLTFKNMIRP